MWVNLLLLAVPLKSKGCSVVLTSIGTACSALHRDWYQINYKQSGGKKPSKTDTILTSISKGVVMDCTCLLTCGHQLELNKSQQEFLSYDIYSVPWKKFMQ